MATITKQKTLVTVGHDDWDYSHFYEIDRVSESAALSLAKKAKENDLRPIEVQSVWVQVFDGSDLVDQFRFDREELRAGKGES